MKGELSQARFTKWKTKAWFHGIECVQTCLLIDVAGSMLCSFFCVIVLVNKCYSHSQKDVDGVLIATM